MMTATCFAHRSRRLTIRTASQTHNATKTTTEAEKTNSLMREIVAGMERWREGEAASRLNSRCMRQMGVGPHRSLRRTRVGGSTTERYGEAVAQIGLRRPRVGGDQPRLTDAPLNSNDRA